MKITAQHKAIDAYEKTLAEFVRVGITHEQGLRPAFQHLLLTLGREAGWTIFVEQKLRSSRKVPDATLRDEFFDRGYWEAKDTKDDLNTEIRKKLNDDKYPSFNIIFEDTREIVLYQQGQEKDRCQMRDRERLAQVLDTFFTYTEPPIAEFHQAVQEFKQQIPTLAARLLERIREERAGNRNREFVAAFAQFHALCQQAINPQISLAAIEEMLVQHLLTSRLFSTVFENQDFINRNVIAVEIEKVIRALTSHSFNRAEFLKNLNKFYEAIETAARDISNWSEKQAFMNTVYERFFQGFAVKQADTYGIVYTPQEIVDFMVASVDDVLKREFGKDLSAEGVQILDPATGTGSFIVNILRRVSGSALERKYRGELFANEIMLLPYYIASLNIEHAYFEQTGHYLPFEGICFADTLDMLTERQQTSMFSEANTARMQRESNARITVIIGNPPYNVGQVNENDNNKNRQYKQVDKRVRDTYAMASKATNKNALSDVYVKFFRWAIDRLGDRDGIVCFVTNNSFVDQIAFDGMRKHLLNDFTEIYHLDLHGNVRKNPKLSGTMHNVFGIQVGVGITIAVRSVKQTERRLRYFRVSTNWRKTEKLAFLTEKQSIAGIDWQELQPDDKYTWLTEGLRADFASFLPIGNKEAKAERELDAEAIFKSYTNGVKTNRDDWAYDYDRDALIAKIKRLIDAYSAELDKWKRRADKTIPVDNFVAYDDTKVKWSESLKQNLMRGTEAKFDEAKIRQALYRPFCKQWLFFDRVLNERVYQLPQCFPTPASEAENLAIYLTGIGSEKPFMTLVTDGIADLHLVGAGSSSQCFPYYTYAEDGSNRQENITDWALEQFRARYGADVGKRHIFHYVYGLLHHPHYRQRYAENLKRELPRIPLAPGREDFDALARAGAALADLHLHYEQAEEHPLSLKETPGERFTWNIKKMRLSPDKSSIVLNDAATLAGVPPECFAYRLSNRSALEWVIDQYQVSADGRSGIVTDPNRPTGHDYDDYIAHLLKRVVTVSLQTVTLVAGLPALPDFGAPGD